MRRCMDDVGVLFHAVPWDRYSRHQRHRHCSGYTVGRKHRGHLLLQFATCTSYKKTNSTTLETRNSLAIGPMLPHNEPVSAYVRGA